VSSPDSTRTDAAAEFAVHRSAMFGIAYRMLGSVMDADDVVQEAYLKWERADRAAVESPRAFLSTIVTRLSIDALREARRRREVYVGEWLPEPLVTGADPESETGLAESLSTAFLLLLETLGPAERAAFLLREVFGQEYAEIAQVLDKSEANCRQMVKRARDRLAAREQRFEPNAQEQERLLSEFLAGAQTGDYERIKRTLAEEAVLHSDHGGKAPAAQRPIHGADKIARFFLGVQRRFPLRAPEIRVTSLNGRPGVVIFSDGRPHSAFTFEWSGDRIAGIYAMRNPEKLAHLTPDRKGAPRNG
jgi:RNA polymerase sigma-70 factor (ECF subfamily)